MPQVATSTTAWPGLGVRLVELDELERLGRVVLDCSQVQIPPSAADRPPSTGTIAPVM